MKLKVLERVLWAASVLALLGAVFALATFNLPAPRGQTFSHTFPPALDYIRSDSITAVASAVVSTNLFRLNRSPSRFDSVQAPAPPQLAVVAPLKPSLRLAGIIGGPPWEALLEGLPSRRGSVVVRVGDEIDGLRIDKVTRDSIIVAATDTIWKLTLKGKGH